MSLDPRSLLAAAAAALSIGATGWSLVRAVSIEPPPVATARGDDRAATADPIFAAITREALTDAVASAPFRPERRRPAARFRLPSEASPDSSARAPAPAGDLRLIGTVVSPDGGGFVMCQLGTETPRVVRLGERIGPYALVGVHQGRARFRSESGELLDVTVPKAGG
jgi:hypothetical protein